MFRKICLVTLFLLATCAPVVRAQIKVDDRSIAPGSAVFLHGEKLALYPGHLRVGQSFLRAVRGTDLDFPFRHRVTIVSIVPSIDTPVCELQTHTLGEADVAPGVDRVTISRDLPFAQERFANAAKLKDIRFLSDYKTGSFGRKTGLMIKGKELLTRGLLVLDAKGIIRYMQLVPELSHLPDVKKAVGFANRLAAAGR